MTSTFFGLETAKRGMTTQQSALYTTSQNISNANTPGYTRQRVNFEQTESYPAPSMNRPQMPGQMGTGVTAGSVQRVRESFLDLQYRDESNQLGYWNTKSDALSKMEDIMNEPSDNGLSATLGQFWQSIEDLSVDPEDTGARSVVLQRGQAVSETFHYLSDSISSIKQDLGNQIGVSVKDVNSTLKQISDINDQISKVEPNGYLPNDLYDERDRLVDQLSSFVNVKVETTKSGGNPSSLAEGIYNIKMTNSTGQDIYLVQNNQYNAIGIKDGTDSDGDGTLDQPPADQPIESLMVGNTEIKIDNNGQMGLSQGKLSGLIESYGYKIDSGTTKGIFPDMLDQLDKMAYTFATVFNSVHQQGYDLNGNQGGDFFTLGASSSNYKDAAKNIDLGPTMTESKLAASTNGKDASGGVESGNGANAINLANVQSTDLSKITITKKVTDPSTGVTTDQPVTLPFTTGTITSNYSSTIGKLGVDAQQANRLNNNSNTLLQSVDNNRQSVSAVSLDEELTNMIKYQQAYNASARNITMIDEMLDKIVNGLGTGGR